MTNCRGTMPDATAAAVVGSDALSSAHALRSAPTNVLVAARFGRAGA